MTIARLDLVQKVLEDTNFEIKRDGTIFDIKKRRLRKGQRGYYFYMYYKGFRVSTARIICTKFHGQPINPTIQVNHKDGVPSNNCADNLEWATSSENIEHKYKVLGYKGVKGHVKIDEHTANKIRILSSNGIPYSVICEKFGICKSTVSYVVNKKTWR